MLSFEVVSAKQGRCRAPLLRYLNLACVTSWHTDILRWGMQESMARTNHPETPDVEEIERREWLESLDYVMEEGGPERVERLLQLLRIHAERDGVRLPYTANTPYINTISAEKEPPLPRSPEIERRIQSLVRRNAPALGVRANREESGIGGGISPHSSAAAPFQGGV